VAAAEELVVMILSDLIESHASARHDSHTSHASSRPLSEGYESVGMVGEAAFALRFGLKMDLALRSKGDGGTDFILPLGFKVDVKTARKPYNLIVEQGKVDADIFILAKYVDDTKEVSFLGWAWKSEILSAPIKDFGHGILNHFIAADRLRPIASLESRVLKFGL